MPVEVRVFSTTPKFRNEIYLQHDKCWYQGLNNKLINILGKSTLKISLKTNKIPTAVKRAKLQALEHKKMFNEIEKNSDTYLKKFLDKKDRP